MRQITFIILILTFVLLGIGTFTVLSASSTFSLNKFDNTFYLFNSHVGKVGLGLLALFVFSIFPYTAYRKVIKYVLFFTIFLLIYTLIAGSNFKGGRRWINLGFLTFQTADAAKIVLFTYLASYIERKGDKLKDFSKGYLPAFAWIILVAGLILIQPNVSNASLIAFICLVMLYVGGAELKHILGTTAAAGFSALLIAFTFFSHFRQRIGDFIESFSNGGTINMQTKQAELGLGSGGIFGVGLGHSRQNNLFLPEAYGDFIFAILGEEWGFIGAIVVLTIFLAIFVLGIIVAKKAQDKFGQLLAFGISFYIVIYAFVNSAVASGLLPTTGLPLPFISYGGTSIIFLCTAVGLLINIGFLNASILERSAEGNLQKA